MPVCEIFLATDVRFAEVRKVEDVGYRMSAVGHGEAPMIIESPDAMVVCDYPDGIAEVGERCPRVPDVCNCEYYV